MHQIRKSCKHDSLLVFTIYAFYYILFTFACLRQINDPLDSTPLNLDVAMTAEDSPRVPPTHSTSAYYGITGYSSPVTPTSRIRYSTDSIISMDEPPLITKSFSDTYKEEKDACTKHFDVWSEHEQVRFIFAAVV